MSNLAVTLEAQAAALEAQAAVLRELARNEAKSDPKDMIDQHASPLGPRRHCAAVQKLVAQGKPGASIVGRRHLLSPEALEVELGHALPRKRSANEVRKAPAPPDKLDELLQKLG